ncbi:MAG TPA: ECF-type sigma factor [Pyrinomonadaceae bacterium]|jgi:RNA polymerase sigma factor (TIGR02999 family)|nr:ECF-type sigma factor [Pyrinomonadaceae bacterium]
MTSSPDITQLLILWSDGNQEALEKLLPLVEKELRRLAHHYILRFRPGNTLQTTAVINEAYIRLVDQNRVQWQNRAHFFGIAASMMRRILLNYLRDNKRLKRGGRDTPISLSEAIILSPEKSREIIALEDALCGLEAIDKHKMRVVELRYYGGLSVEETAEALKISTITVIRDWNFAKAWLAREIRNE